MFHESEDLDNPDFPIIVDLIHAKLKQGAKLFFKPNGKLEPWPIVGIMGVEILGEPEVRIEFGLGKSGAKGRCYSIEELEKLKLEKHGEEFWVMFK
jgi:hypothetical protein